MTLTKPKALHFGAGNIGRGFIGPLLVHSDYHVIFVDVDKKIIDQLNERASYHVHIIGSTKEPNLISSISGMLSQGDDVIKQFADPTVRIVTTAVGPTVLVKLASTIARGLQARRKADAGPLNIIACENMVRQTTELRRLVSQHLQSDDQPWVDTHVGFASCSVDRIVPPGEPMADPLDVRVEEFHEWIVDETALRAPIEPKVNGMDLTRDLDAYVERKIFTLNCGHAIAAYLGSIKHYTTVDQAIQDPRICSIVRGAMVEAGAALIEKHQFDRAVHAEYIEKVMKRIADPNLADTILRVGRQPLRKLAVTDRLVGPVNLARKYGLPVDNLVQGIAAAFLFDTQEDEQSVELQDKIKSLGIAKAVTEITGFEEGSEEHTKVLGAYRDLQR
jgi:mannitol-1-phosphate 5-dehydrogenase